MLLIYQKEHNRSSVPRIKSLEIGFVLPKEVLQEKTDFNKAFENESLGIVFYLQ